MLCVSRRRAERSLWKKDAFFSRLGERIRDFEAGRAGAGISRIELLGKVEKLAPGVLRFVSPVVSKSFVDRSCIRAHRCSGNNLDGCRDQVAWLCFPREEVDVCLGLRILLGLLELTSKLLELFRDAKSLGLAPTLILDSCARFWAKRLTYSSARQIVLIER